MNRQVSVLRIVLLVVALLAVAYVGYSFFLVPWLDSELKISEYRKQIESEEDQLRKITRDMPKLERWRLVSLPSETNLNPKASQAAQDQADALKRTQDVYLAYLRDLGDKTGFAPFLAHTKGGPDFKAAGLPMPNGLPAYTSLSFQVDGKAKLASAVNFMVELQRAPLLHRIKNLTLKREGGDKDPKKAAAEMLTLQITLEALVVNSPSKRPADLLGFDHRLAVLDAVAGWRRAPVGLALVPWAAGPYGPRAQALQAQPSASRIYADIAKKNIFTGPRPEPLEIVKGEKKQEPRPTEDLITFTRVSGITFRDHKQGKVDLVDLSRNWWDTVQEKADYNWIPLVKDGDDRVVIYGQVTRIVSTRYLIFKVQLRGASPDTSSKKRYPSDKAIYRLHKDDLDALVKAKTAEAEQIDRLYRVSKSNWEWLVRDKVVALKGSDFAFRWDLVRGKIVERGEGHVILRLDEKFCGFRMEDEKRPSVSPHLGYCYLYNGNKLVDGLRQPLPESEVKKELVSVSAQPQ